MLPSANSARRMPLPLLRASAGKPVTLIGFGTFARKHRDARTGRNPATGKEIKIPASNTPVFKAGKAFKDKVNG